MTWLDRPGVVARNSRAALRRRAAARERARLGRDLHDGVLQGLIAIDMQLETALRSSADAANLAGTMESAQQRLRGEVAALRVLVDEARSRDIAPDQLAFTIDRMVWQFNRACGISAACFMPPQDEVIKLPKRVCSELVRVVREALNNVRRHSGAGNVVVELACGASHYTLSITDDGKGMGGARPPVVMSERVAAIGSRLTLQPMPRGTRVVVTIPREGPWKQSGTSESWWRTIILSFVTG